MTYNFKGVEIALLRNCLGNLYAAVQRFGPIDADIQFAMREAAQVLGPPYSSVETRTEAAPEPPEATWICDCGRSNYVTVTRCEVCELRRNPERLALNR
jgi:hypothetical protein